MKTRRAVGRYAQALFDLAEEEGVTDAVETDLASLARGVAGSAELAGFLADIALGRRERRAVLSALFRDRAHPLVWRFLALLESKRRLALLADICAYFGRLCERRRGVMPVEARIAIEADEEMQMALSAGIAARLKCRVDLSVRADSGLMGGFAFQAGDIVYDYSVAGSLRAMRERWAAPLGR